MAILVSLTSFGSSALVEKEGDFVLQLVTFHPRRADNTGSFTCPLEGVYLFSANVRLDNINGHYFRLLGQFDFSPVPFIFLLPSASALPTKNFEIAFLARLGVRDDQYSVEQLHNIRGFSGR